MKKYVDEFVDFGPGKQFCPSDLHIAYYKPLKQQVAILREDMLQIYYGDDSLNYVIDVGWYGQSFSLKGRFIVYLVKNGEWQTPLIRVKCKLVKRLVPALELCMNRVRVETDNFNLLSLK